MKTFQRCDECTFCILEMFECHRYPPTCVPAKAMDERGLGSERVVTYWPTVQPYDKCGEFKQKDEFNSERKKEGE